MSRSVIQSAFEHAREHVARAHDLNALERLEGCSSLDPCTVRRQQLLEFVVSRARRNLGDRAHEAVSLPRHGLNVRLSVWSGTKGAAQRRDRLLETVVCDRNVLPDCL